MLAYTPPLYSGDFQVVRDSLLDEERTADHTCLASLEMEFLSNCLFQVARLNSLVILVISRLVLSHSAICKHLITLRLRNAEGVPNENSQGHSLVQEIALALIWKSHGQSATQICIRLDRQFSHGAGNLDRY